MAHTSADVAKLAGVSRSTVSYILNGKGERFAPETVKAVQDAIAKLNYLPQPAGRSLVRGRTDIVVVLLSRFAGGLGLTFWGPLADQFSEAGLSLVLVPAQTTDSAFVSMISNVRPCVAVVLGWLTDEQSDVLQRYSVPALKMGDLSSRPGNLDERVANLQVDHLVKQGFTNIAYGRLNEAAGDSFMEARQRFVIARCKELGLNEPEVLSLSLRSEDNVFTVKSLEAGTGIAAYNDDVAAAILGAAQLSNRGVPAEIGVIGVDDAPVSTQTFPMLTTIKTHGIYLDKLVENIVAAANGAEAGYVGLEATVELVERDSA